MRRLLLVSLLLGCSTAVAPGPSDSGSDASTDAEAADTGAADASGPDAQSGDAGPAPIDAAMEESDAALDDAGPIEMDSGWTEPDAWMDPELPDAGTDADVPDVGTDAGTPDAGSDAGMPDAGSDAGMPDTGPPCVPRTEFCGLPADEDCDGTVDEGCGPCAVGFRTCSAGCCPLTETEITYDGVSPDIDVDARGNVYVLYSVPSSGLWSTRLSRYDASTSRWTDFEIGTSEGSERAALRLDEDGGVHIVAGRDGRNLRYYYSSSGTGFSSVLLTSTYDIGGQLDLAVRDGVVHVVYTSSDPIRIDRLIYRTGGFRGGFATQTIDDSTEIHSHPRVAVDADGNPWLLYEAYTTALRTRLRVAHHDGGAWSYTDIETDPVGVGREWFNHHFIQVTSTGQVRAFYHRGLPADPQLRLAERSSTGAWSSRLVLADRTASMDDLEDEPVYAANGVITYATRGGVLRSLAAPANMGVNVALRRVGNELYVAYESLVTRDAIMFARLPLP